MKAHSLSSPFRRTLSLGAGLCGLLSLVSLGQAQGSCNTCWDDIFRPQDQGFPAIGDPMSNPGPKITWNNRVFFGATRPPLGLELFWTDACDGDYAPLSPFKGYFDIAATVPDQASNPREFTEFDQRLWFVADADLNGTTTSQLFFMGPEYGDTVPDHFPVQQTPVSPVFTGVQDLTLHGDQLWFTAVGSLKGYGLGRYPWYIQKGEVYSGVSYVVLLKPRSINGSSSHNVIELESAGKYMSMIVSFPYSSPVPSLQDIWITAGEGSGFSSTAEQLASDMNGAAELTYVPNQDTVYWIPENEPACDAGDGLRGYLWGSLVANNAGPVAFRDGSCVPFNPENLHSAGGQLFFTGESETYGREPFVCDGSMATLLYDIVPGEDSSNPFDFVHDGTESSLFFLTDNGSGIYDGLYFHLINSDDVMQWEIVESPRNLQLLENNFLYWSGQVYEEEKPLGQELWQTWIGGLPFTATTCDLNPASDSDPKDFVYLPVSHDPTIPGSVLFTATSDQLFRELVWIDG